MDDTPDHPKESFSPEIGHYYPLQKKRISQNSQKQTYYRPKKSKKFSIIRRDMRKKSESNHASLSSTLTTFWANNSFVFERYLIFFVKKSNNTYSMIRCDLRRNRHFGGGGVIYSWRKTNKSKIIIQA